MRRYLLLAIAVMMLIPLTASATYKLVLDTGEVVSADDKPVIRGDRAFFSIRDLHVYLDIRRIDFQKSEEVNKPAAPEEVQFEEEVIEHRPKTAKRKINDQDLDELRGDVRLANEGELYPAYGDDWMYDEEYPEEGEAPAPEAERQARAPQQEDNRAVLQRRVNDLVNQSRTAQQERDRLQSEYRSLREQLDMSTDNDARENYASQIDSVRNDMSTAQSRVTDLNAQIRATQQEIASQPVIVPITTGPQ
jgi:hypothetical protein